MKTHKIKEDIERLIGNIREALKADDKILCNFSVTALPKNLNTVEYEYFDVNDKTVYRSSIVIDDYI